MPNTLNVYVSYADEDIIFTDTIYKHFSTLIQQNIIELWHRGLVQPGSDFGLISGANLNNADIVIILISSDYLNSDYWTTELPLATKRAKEGTCLLIPVLIRSCDYYNLSEQEMVPKGPDDRPKAISKWEDQDDAFDTVVVEFKRRIGFFKEAVPNPVINMEEDVEKHNSQITAILELFANGQFPSPNINVQDTDIKSKRLQIGPTYNFNFNENKRDNSASAPNDEKKEQPFRRQLPLSAKNIWKKIPISKHIEKVTLLELNRKKEFIDQLMCDFDANSPSSRNLFYFIGACHSQCPDILARRFVLYCQKSFMSSHIEGTDNFDKLEIYELLVARSPNETFERLWRFMKSKLSFEWYQAIHNNGEFDGFKTSIPNFLSNDLRIPILIKVKENQWQKQVDTHLEYIVKQFLSWTEVNRRFVFIIILEMGHYHTFHRDEGHEIFQRKQKIQKIKNTMEALENNSHFFWLEILEYIHEKDLEEWLHQIIDDRSADRDKCYQILLTALLHEMSEAERSIAKEKGLFINANRLSQYQRTAYNELIKKASSYAI